MASLPADDILCGLNEAQTSAVSSPSDVLQVLAPPGSGKTKTLTARVAYLIAHHGIEPSHIVVCTFTVKAAREMQERIVRFIGSELAGRLILGTFHSVARRLLVKYGRLIDLDPNFDIADSADSKALITRLIKDHKLDIKPNVARNRISSMKSDGVTAEDHIARSQLTKARTVEQQEFDQVFALYEEKHRIDNVLDYDDLLLYCRRLLTSHPHCVALVQAVLIDEFQDTNNVQYDLMKLLAQQRQRISIVGDPDQSIYGWRSAQIANLFKMRSEFPDTHIVNLEENYRSSACILLAAQEVIEQDTSRHQKTLAPTHSAGEQPVLRRLRTPREEACWITDEARRCRDLTGGLLDWNDFAILIRSAFLSRVVEQALGRAGIPYRMVGGHRFFDRIEVRVVLDYLRCISHTSHSEAMLRVLNVPSRKLGDKSIAALLNKSVALQCPLWNVVLGVSRGDIRLDPPLTSAASQGLGAFVAVILSAQKRLAADPKATIEAFARHVMEKLQFQTFLEREYKNEDSLEARKSNLDELMTQMKEVDEALLEVTLDDRKDGILNHGDRPSSEDAIADRLAHFLAQVALSTDKKESDESQDTEGQLTISTMHAAKGLEWPVVFIPAVYEGSVPHSRAEDHDEERRLLYVAMTRAQALLYLSCPTTDTNNAEVHLSQFLDQGPVQAQHISRGPSFGYDLVHELAKILRRQDRKLDIEAGRATTTYIEDDLYPERPGMETEDGEAHVSSRAPSNPRKRPADVNLNDRQAFAKRSSPSDLQGFVSARDVLKGQSLAGGSFRSAKEVFSGDDKENARDSQSIYATQIALKTKIAPTVLRRTTSNMKTSARESKTKLAGNQSTLSSFFGSVPSGKEERDKATGKRNESRAFRDVGHGSSVDMISVSHHITTMDRLGWKREAKGAPSCSLRPEGNANG